MTVEPRTDEDDARRHAQTRVLLALPLMTLLCASGLALITAPVAWGAADVIDAPGWMPPALGLLVALGGIWIGTYALRIVLRRTRGPFRVLKLQLVFGVVISLAGAAMMVALADRLPDSATYARALDENGDYTLPASAFFIMSLILGAFQLGWVWVGAYLYSHAITDDQPNRISERHPGEVDGVGALLRERS